MATIKDAPTVDPVADSLGLVHQLHAPFLRLASSKVREFAELVHVPAAQVILDRTGAAASRLAEARGTLAVRGVAIARAQLEANVTTLRKLSECRELAEAMAVQNEHMLASVARTGELMAGIIDLIGLSIRMLAVDGQPVPGKAKASA